MITASMLLPLLLPALVSAHGFVSKVSIDGIEYLGNPVGTTATIPSIIRQVNTNSPVKGADSPDINCGPGAQRAANTANANPGSTVEVHWVGGTTANSGPWPHVTGPIMHYMTRCDGPCEDYDSGNAEWFKILEQGLESDNSTWYQAELHSGSPATVTIPNDLAAGSYLMRSELISLQNSVSVGGAEFFPSCVQLNVGGSQTGQPTSSEEVRFPGGYSDTDPGIYTPGIYDPPVHYEFPGPPVASFVSGGTSLGSSPGPGSTSPTAAASPPATTDTVTDNPPSSTVPLPSPSPSPSSSASPTSGDGAGNGTCMTEYAEARVNSGSMQKRRRPRRATHYSR